MVEDELLDYQDPLEGDDVTLVEGAAHVERTLQTLAKRDGIRGVIAAPLVTTKEGVPQHFTWVVTSAKDDVGTVPEAGKLKWNGNAGIIYPNAGADVTIRMDMDLRNVKWRAGTWCSAWQSCEDLGISLGTRKKRGVSSGLGKFEELTEDEVAKFGHSDFPVRLEIAPGPKMEECLITIMAIPRKFADRKSLPGEGFFLTHNLTRRGWGKGPKTGRYDHAPGASGEEGGKMAEGNPAGGADGKRGKGGYVALRAPWPRPGGEQGGRGE